jgi:hypothetical protein
MNDDEVEREKEDDHHFTIVSFGYRQAAVA